MAAVPIELTDDGNRRFNLITRNLQEILGSDKIKTQIANGKNMHLYWGTATTGRPHVGYMVPIRKVADFLQAGVKVTILFADLHAFLDNLKSTFEVLEYRTKYYEIIIRSLMKALDVPVENLTFVRGSSYQLTEAYTTDVLKLCGQVSQRDALRAGAEVVKQVDSPLLSGLLYPLLQALDEPYLKVDGQFGGVDQRKIFILAEEQLPKLKLGKRWHLMNPMVPGLHGSKMSASVADSKIDLFDSPSDVTKKIDSAICPKNSDENGILALYKHVVLPIILPTDLVLDEIIIDSYETLENAFNNDSISETTLKTYFKVFINELLGNIQTYAKMDGGEDFEELMKKAYPESIDTTVNKIVFEETKDSVISKENLFSVAKLFNDTVIFESPISTEKRVCFRVSPKGRVHLGHILGLYRLKKLISMGFDCSILISDLDAFLDNEKCQWKALEGRTNYYIEMFTQFISVIGGLEKVKILKSNEKQFKHEYTLDMYKMASKITRDDSSIVPGNTLATHLIPLYYALDIHYNKFDISIVSSEDRLLAETSTKLLSSLGYKTCSHILMEPLPGMNGTKMSSSAIEFALDPLDTAKQIKTKIGKSFCEPGNINKCNVALQLCKHIFFGDGSDDEHKFNIERSDENGGNITLTSYDDLVDTFAKELLHPADLKATITKIINDIFDPIRKAVSQKQTKMIKEAFPPVTGGKKK
ncbi:Tyrosine--tRNA ligase, cytoplasmic [Strongyloides ratti]|uniref:Tyrosine--tRNA ligase n=1 Tax=Strongyloides ratti TaxID=34506 RepID=A0A090MYP6_STRRB|nr:Tyrosine--tRNA ligase, cytoplasmic [Strongyloides ratti]CEF67549.1 Tyrosine--tRNA ligase, cytoplasmic [Strongyloides ratti]